MRKFLIVSHGRMASGIKSSVDVLTGDSSAITAVDSYLDESDYTQEVRSFLEGCAPDDEAIVFTDILGGSVFQRVVQEDLARSGVTHVTGTNLAVVLECLLTPDALTLQTVDGICQTAAGQLKRVEAPVPGSGADATSEKGKGSSADDDFFA